MLAREWAANHERVISGFNCCLALLLSCDYYPGESLGVLVDASPIVRTAPPRHLDAGPALSPRFRLSSACNIWPCASHSLLFHFNLVVGALANKS